MLTRLWKPWYVHRPTQLLRRARSLVTPPVPGYQPLVTSWGVRVRADPAKTIGHSIWTTGIHDITVSEVVARLVDPGDTVIDAGANVGYMTLLAAVAAGAQGTVLSFEPHPALFQILEQNVAEAARDGHRLARTELRHAALGAQRGRASLVVPDDFASNDGVSRIGATAAPSERTIEVAIETIDDALGGRSASVMKLDVEGFELEVLGGASRALGERRIRHVVFEDHDIGASGVARRFQAAGYRVASLGWSVGGIAIAPIDAGPLPAHYEAPTFLASIALDDAVARCRPRGWSVLRRDLGDRRR